MQRKILSGTAEEDLRSLIFDFRLKIDGNKFIEELEAEVSKIMWIFSYQKVRLSSTIRKLQKRLKRRCFMFRYDNSEEMKVFLDRVVKCENEQEREMLEQIKHYLDYPEQLSAIHEAESFLSVKLGMKKPPEDIVCKIAEQMYEEFAEFDEICEQKMEDIFFGVCSIDKFRKYFGLGGK